MKRNTLRFVIVGCAVIALLLALPLRAQDDVEIPTRDYWPTDGWQVSAPEEQGLDTELITDISLANATTMIMTKTNYTSCGL